ncbi:MAG: DUF1570 domain-containing protein [Chthoniobacterales bacterium]
MADTPTPNFELVDINGTLEADDFDLLIRIIQEELEFDKIHLKLANNIVIPIRLFEEDENYRAFQKKISKSRSGNGFYSVSRKELIIYKNAKYRKTIQHEAQHLILRSAKLFPPKWLNEGLAEFYEEAFLDKAEIYTRPNQAKKLRLKRLLKENKIVSLRKIFSDFDRDWKKMEDNYTLSWGLVYFFMADMQRKEVLRKIINLSIFQNFGMQWIIEKHYEGGVDHLEKDFHDFIANMPEKIRL